MEQGFLNTPVAPGQILTHEIDGEVVGWLIGEIDGSKIWIGQMITADLALAGIYGAIAEEPVIWIAVIEADRPRIRGFVGDYEKARELAVGTAAIIRTQIEGRIQ